MKSEYDVLGNLRVAVDNMLDHSRCTQGTFETQITH